MAAGRVSLGYLATAACLSLGAAAATFQLKLAVRDLERGLVEVEARIEEERSATRAARADLAYLTRPERIVMQAEQLGMVPARGGRLVQGDQLPTYRQLELAGAAPRAATLPSGAAASLRARPAPVLTLTGGGGGG